MKELFPSSSQPMEKPIISPMASHRKDKTWKVSPRKALFLLSAREALFATGSLTTQRWPRRSSITPSQHQRTDTQVFL